MRELEEGNDVNLGEKPKMYSVMVDGTMLDVERALGCIQVCRHVQFGPESKC